MSDPESKSLADQMVQQPQKILRFLWPKFGHRKTDVPQTQSYQGLAGLFGSIQIIPTRCRDLRLKQFCLEDVVPAVLIILIAHIVLAVRWMLIKILSVVINHHGTVIRVVSGGCYPNSTIICKTDRKIKILTVSFSYKQSLLSLQQALQ